MAAVTAVSWAVLAIALKFALKSLSSGTIVWTRMVLAFVILLALFAWHDRRGLKILRRPPWMGLLAGALISCNYFGFMKGVELTTASNAQIMIQLAPMAFALISIFAFKEVPAPLQICGLLTAVSGFGFFYWDQILVSYDQLDRFQEGNLWLLMAAGTWSIFALLQKFLMKRWKPQEFNLLIYGLSAVLLFPTADMDRLDSISTGSAVLILFLALNTVVAYGAFAEALTRIPATHVSVIIAVNPLLTIALMDALARMEVQWIAAEPIHWRGYLGAALVVLGVILTVTNKPGLSSRR